MNEARVVEPGHLYVVATPIGHLGDLSPRAAAVLRAADQVLAEDTRTTGLLLQQLGIQTALLPLHEHNERARADDLGRLLVSVQDTGPGVDPDILQRLFNPFQTNKPGGMGMGLSISQNIIEAHGGELWAERPASGALFCFTLPTEARETHEQ